MPPHKRLTLTLPIQFDDLPDFDVNTSTKSSASKIRGPRPPPQILNPYQKLYFNSNYSYLSPPSSPYIPQSSPNLAIYRAIAASPTSSAHDSSDSNGEMTPNLAPVDDGFLLPGELGSGPHADSSMHWISPVSGFFGCTDGNAALPCILTIRGYVGVAPRKQPSVAQVVTVPPCPAMTGCELVPVTFRDDFEGLTALQVVATVGEEMVDWYVDDLVIDWFDTSCEAQTARAMTD